MLNFCASLDNFIAIGRSALFRYNNMDHSIAVGRRAAAAVLAGGRREEAIRIATGKEYFG